MKAFQAILPAFLILTAVPVLAAEWVSIEGTDRFFDISRIRVESDGIVRVWQKSVHKDYVIRRLENDLRRNGTPVDYTGYSYSIELWEMNCKQETYAVKSGTSYAQNGRVIDSFDLKDVRFSPVTPDSEGEAAFRTVCAYVSRKHKSIR